MENTQFFPITTHCALLRCMSKSLTWYLRLIHISSLISCWLNFPYYSGWITIFSNLCVYTQRLEIPQRRQYNKLYKAHKANSWFISFHSVHVLQIRSLNKTTGVNKKWINNKILGTKKFEIWTNLKKVNKE